MSTVVRLRFERDASMMFISHLEMMNAFQRAIRRTPLAPSYSHGFNPQMKMVFGAPLSVGATSESEYVDISFEKPYPPDEIRELLKKTLPPGLQIKEAKIRSIKKNIMADIAYAYYRLTFDRPVEEWVNHLQNSDAIMATKKSKKAQKEINIKPFIHKVKNTNPYQMEILLSAGQISLNIHTLCEGLSGAFNEKITPTQVHRLQLYVKRNDRPCHPMLQEALEKE